MPNPFVFNEAATASDSSTEKEFREYAYDFERNCFIYNADGSHKILTRNEALKVWVQKTLLTERYRYRAYFDDYGAELEHFIGTVTNDDEQATAVFGYIEESLLVNPYIISVDNVSAEQDHKRFTLKIELTTVYGNSTLAIEV